MTEPSFSPNPPPLPRLLKLIVGVRLISAIAVLSALAGSLLMLIIGAKNTLSAFLVFWQGDTEALIIEPAEEATLRLLESLDNFLVGLAFLYFAFGIYSLFIVIDRKNDIGPQWLQVKDISELKQSLLEVLVVLLSVVFVKRMLETVSPGHLEWQILVIPLSIVAIALSSRLMSAKGTDL